MVTLIKTPTQPLGKVLVKEKEKGVKSTFDL
jgi:hypothetical protein